jgi:hypothetical protein
MIIVEGADNVGKTTLVQQLLEEDPTLRLLDRPRFRPGQGETIGDSYLRALLPLDAAHDYQAQAHSVADRFLASECIYGELFRGGCRMTADQHMILRGLLLQYNAIVIWCDPPDAAISRTWHEREQMYSQERSLSIALAYRLRLPSIFYGFPVLRYDWTTPGAASWRKMVLTAHKVNRANRLYSIPCNLLSSDPKQP